MILSFRIQGKMLTKINYQEASKTPNIYKCKFYFDEKTWKGQEIFVVFKNNYGYSTIVPLGKYSESLSCTLPGRMLTDKYFKMFIYAKDSFQTNSISVILSEQCKTKIKKANTLSDILKEVEKKIDNVYFDENQLKFFANGELIDTVYIDNVDEVLIDERVQESLSSFKENINQKFEEFVRVNDIRFENGVIFFK